MYKVCHYTLLSEKIAYAYYESWDIKFLCTTGYLENKRRQFLCIVSVPQQETHTEQISWLQLLVYNIWLVTSDLCLTWRLVAVLGVHS